MSADQNTVLSLQALNRSAVRLSIVLIIALPLSLVCSISLGSVDIPISDIIAFCLGRPSSEGLVAVIQDIRLPRALLASLVGAMLGICGATTQGLFRNPLADPSLIGVTAGASAGAALTIYFAATVSMLSGFSGIAFVSLGAFLGGALAVTGVYKLATDKTGTSVATMLLAGIAITAVAGALTNFVEYFADNEDLRRISLWQMGGIDGANYLRVTIASLAGLLIFSILPLYSSALNALLLGESEARHLGISVQKTKRNLILLVALGVGICVALSGTIAFIGLVVPHIIRLLIGPNHRFLLPLSALGGAILLILADTLARTAFAPTELPVGLVTALFGAPFFISLLRNRKKFGMGA